MTLRGKKEKERERRTNLAHMPTLHSCIYREVYMYTCITNEDSPEDALVFGVATTVKSEFESLFILEAFMNLYSIH